MTPATFVLLSGTLTFGVPIVLAIRELITLTPRRRDGRDEPPPEPRLIPAPTPLPNCLLPPLFPVAKPPLIRMMEDA